MSAKFTYISDLIITNDTDDKEYFNPRKKDINELIKLNENWKIFKAGSAVFFDIYDDYKPHDYDFFIVSKIDEYHNPILMSYKHLVDFFEYFYTASNTKDDIIKDFINRSMYFSNTLYINKYIIVNLLNKEVLKYFNISFNDFKKYIDEFKKIINKDNFNLSKSYYIKILEYYIENQSFDLTKELLNNCYSIYKKYRQNKNRQ